MSSVHYAKLKPPRPGRILFRKRLFEALDRWRPHTVTWLPAPAGAGKTLLLASYIQERQTPCLWYQLDPSDNDPAAFFQCLSKAARALSQSSGDALPAFSAEYFSDLPSFAKRFFEAMVRMLPKTCSIVFDDYHDLGSKSILHTVYRHGLGAIPEELHVFILSRGEPPPPLVRMQVTGTMRRLSGARLQLTPGEALEVAGILGEIASEKDRQRVKDIYRTTEGWAAGFVLSLVRGDDSGPVPGLSRDTLFDYFTGEILDELAPPARTFLEMTALFPEFTADMARRLTGHPKPEEILSALVRNNQFTLLRGDGEAVYRYHALFRECLLQKAKKSFREGEFQTLQVSAADILLTEGAPEEAFEILTDGGSWTEAADLIRIHAPALIEQGRSATLDSWLANIPAGIIDRDPWLLFWRGTAKMPLRGPQAARGSFEQAYENFKRHKEVNGIFLAWCGVVESYIFDFGDFRPLGHWVDELHHLCEQDPLPDDPMIRGRVVLNMLSALCFCRPEGKELEPWMEEAERLLRFCPPGLFRLCLVRQLIHLAAWKGDCAGVSALLEEIEPDEALYRKSPLEITYYLTFTVMGPWLLGDFEKAMDYVERGLAAAGKSGLKQMVTPLLAHGAFTALSRGDTSDAKKFLTRMKPLVSPERLLDYGQYHFLQSWLKALMSQSGAERHLETAIEVGKESGTPYPQAVNSLAMAALCLEQGRLDAVANFLKPAEELAASMPSAYLALKCELTRAEMALGRGNLTAADAHLQKAFGLMRETGLVNFDFWRPRAMSRLCDRALEAGIEKDFLRRLIRQRQLAPPDNARDHEIWPWPVKIYTLGRFSVAIDGEPLRFERKGQKRPLQLLQAIVALGGRDISQIQLEDSLWPDAPGDTATKNLNTTIYRLRKLIGGDALRLEDGRVSLDARFCWVDLWACERLLGRMSEMLRKDSPEEIVLLSDRVLALLQGTFLDRESREPWMLPVRERLRRRTSSVFTKVGRYLGRQGLCEKSMEILDRLIDIDPYAEDFHRSLMACKAAKGRTAEALAIYKSFCELLTRSFQTRPSPKAETLHHAIRNQDQAALCSICAVCRNSSF